MVEGPFGNVEITGPMSINEVLIQGSLDEKLNADEEYEIVKRLDKASGGSFRLQERETVFRYFEEFEPPYGGGPFGGHTTFIAHIGEEVEENKLQQLIEEMKKVGFSSIVLSVGDPKDRMIQIIQNMNNLRP